MRALVRAVPDSFARALSAAVPDPPIDVARARVQHAAYVDGLRALGLEIIALPADEACPDCCFVEDTAVVAGRIALITRPGAPSRRAEVNAVAQVLARDHEVVRMEAPATLEGGDCLRLGSIIYVGRSARSNDQGMALLAQVLGVRVVPVEMPAGVLHLTSVCSALDDETVLVVEGTLPASLFPRVLTVPRAEAHAANTVVHRGAALIAAGCPRTADLVAAAGVRPIPVDTGEMRKADGALTCLSVLLNESSSP